MQSNCKSCTKAHTKKHYATNKDRYFKSKLASKERIYAIIDKLKAEPCTDCGGCFPPEAMDFDHIEDNKEYGVARLVSDNSLTKALAEIAKCELVCANCHRVRTRKRRAALAE